MLAEFEPRQSMAKANFAGRIAIDSPWGASASGISEGCNHKFVNSSKKLGSIKRSYAMT